MKTFIWYTFCLLLVSTVFFTCEQDSTADDPIQDVDATALPHAELDQFFSFLVARRDLDQLSPGKQLAAFEVHVGKSGYVDRAIALQDEADAVDQQLSANVIDAFQTVDDIFAEGGFGTETLARLSAFRREVATASKLSEEEKLHVSSYLDMVSYLATSEQFQLLSYRLEDNKTGVNTKGLWKCFTSFWGAYAATLGCVLSVNSGNVDSPIKCGSAIIAWVNVYKNCSPSGGMTGKPCEFSTDPCCGTRCASGRICDRTGNCVIDPNGSGCLARGCGLYERCLNNVCVPL